MIAFVLESQDLYAQETDIDKLQQEIEAKNEEIKKLEEEAERYRKELQTTQEQGKNLQTELARIDRTIRKLRQDIAVTRARIKKAELQISQLAADINDKEKTGEALRDGLNEILRTLYEQEHQPLIAALVQNKFLSGFFRQFDYISRAKERMLGTVKELRILREELAIKKVEAETTKEKTEDLQRLLSSRKVVVDQERNERNELLRATKNQEKAYQELVHEREERIRALAEEIRAIENEIRFTLDPSSLPSKGSGVLGWPLVNLILESCWNGNSGAKKDAHCITQYFGYTSFARIGGYNGQGHNGADFRASPGDEVFAAEGGGVRAIGDTDLGCRGASYGKWILIEHSNNLSTLYAHLSYIGVSKGASVKRGERVGLSGQTGYATGPHLHFGVLITQAVKIKTITSIVCGRPMTLPVAGKDEKSKTDGYLNPMDYL